MSNDYRPVFPAIRMPQFEDQELPDVVTAKLHHPVAPELDDVAAATRAALEKSRRFAELPKGARVAITCGSRGIQSKPLVVATAVAWLKERGFEPFIVPAMGSHGGARAESQVELLAELGYTLESMGCAIESSMDVTRIGTTSRGVPVYFDKNAAAADAVLVVNRIKAHTSFDREIESGLTKMVAIGLGKAEGARLIHKLGVLGYLEVLPEWAGIAINASPIAYAIGIVENADKRATLIEGAEPEDIMAMDARLLPLAKANTPKLPFAQIDLLIVERLGKNISGTGMDTGVVGRADIRGRPSVDNPLIHKLAVLGLTPEAHGNGLGVGLADFMTQEVANSLDLYAMYMNSCTSTFTERVRLPIVLADDKAVIQAAVGTCWQLDGRDARLCIIRSTLHLDQILISPAMAGELGDKGEVVDTPQALEFDSAGHLLTRCPE
jgi:hypothetical protein